VTQETNEKVLLEGLAVSDKKAVETIYRSNFNMVQSLVINNNGSVDDAKDIFQEVMIVLYEKARSGDFELNCQIRTFVYSVSRRLWLKRLQQQNRFTSSGDSMEPVVPIEEDIEEHDRRNIEFDMMENAISHLGEPCKSLIEAYYLQKQTMQEIAARFGYTNADNAKNQKYKCLMRLKKIFFTNYKNGNSDG
jgi:RNA polymerase sigma factor (sigma-70 family)